jgi:hypothetical protein
MIARIARASWLSRYGLCFFDIQADIGGQPPARQGLGQQLEGQEPLTVHLVKPPQQAEIRLTSKDLWRLNRAASRHLEDVLGATVNLPLRYWRADMLFSGAPDDRLHDLTAGLFPLRLVKKKTHPLFCLQVLPDAVGCRVCPCTSSRPRRAIPRRSIRQGCILAYTGQIMDRESYLVDEILFNVPADLAFKLRFRGLVPEKCLSGESNHQCREVAP